MTPTSIFSTLGVKRELKLSMVENNVSFDNAKFEPIWISTTECRITPIRLPTISLWEKEGFEARFTAKDWIEKEICVNNKELHFNDITPFEVINVTFIANGEKKHFSINPPIRKITFNANYNPSITIAHEFTTNQTINIKVMDCLTKKGIPMTYDRDDNKKPILLTKKWYNSLIDDTLIVINIKDDSYFSDDIELLVEAPPYTYFRPKPTNIMPGVSAEKGYFVKFKLDPLSPRMRDFSGTFKEEGGKEIPFKVIDGTATISFDNISESNSTLKTKEGSIDLEHYYYNYEDKPTIEFEFGEHCSFLGINNLDRTSNKSLVEITITENWFGNTIISINKDSIADQNFVKLHEKEFKEFEFEINKMANISVNEIREKIPLIDEYFISTRAKMITLDLIHIPFNNSEVFGQQIISLQINREETIFKFVREYEYEECGTERIWEVDYLEDYFPESNKFIFKYCGKTFSPETILDNGKRGVFFKVPQPEYDEVKNNPLWELQYDGIIIRGDDVLIQEITFTNQINEIVLLCLEEDSKFISSPTIGTTDNNSQPHVKIEINLKLGDEKEKIIETVAVAEVGTLYFSKIESHIEKNFNKLHNQKGYIGDLSITIPSRNQLLVTLPICVDEGGEYRLSVLSKWLLTSWDKTISHLDEFSEMKEYLYLLILRDGKGIFLRNVCFSLEPIADGTKRLNQVKLLDHSLKETKFLKYVINIDGNGSKEKLELARNWYYWFAANKSLLKNNELQNDLFKHWSNKLIKLVNKNRPYKTPQDTLGYWNKWINKTNERLEQHIMYTREDYIKKLEILLTEITNRENAYGRNSEDMIQLLRKEKEKQENIELIKNAVAIPQPIVDTKLEDTDSSDEISSTPEDSNSPSVNDNIVEEEAPQKVPIMSQKDPRILAGRAATQSSMAKFNDRMDKPKKKTPTKSNIQKPKPSPKKTNNPENEGRRDELINRRQKLSGDLLFKRNKNYRKKDIRAAELALNNFDRNNPSVKEWIN